MLGHGSRVTPHILVSIFQNGLAYVLCPMPNAFSCNFLNKLICAFKTIAGLLIGIMLKLQISLAANVHL